MATSTPFVNVSVNRFGFNILDVRINLVGTENPKAVVAMLVLATAGIRPDDSDCAEQMDWIESQYSKELDAQASCSVLSEYVLKPFYVNDDLVSFRYEVVYDNY
jgi:hypothetical protein